MSFLAEPWLCISINRKQCLLINLSAGCCSAALPSRDVCMQGEVQMQAEMLCHCLIPALGIQRLEHAQCSNHLDPEDVTD